jgi:hypothetical protein
MGGAARCVRPQCYPGADTYLMGAVSVGVVASVYGSHLQWRAAEVLSADGRGGSTHRFVPNQTNSPVRR